MDERNSAKDSVNVENNVTWLIALQIRRTIA